MSDYNPNCRHCTQELPARTADTMSNAIAASSPSGHMSKRFAKATGARLHNALFGNYDPRIPHMPTAREQAAQLRRSAQDMREWAARGMQPKRMLREAERLEAQAIALEGESK